MDVACARIVLRWRYPAPYDVYNTDPSRVEQAIVALVDPRNAYYAVVDQTDEIAAYCCFGVDARVAGGDYDPEALDVGLGVRPDLTGRGEGLKYVTGALDFAQRTYSPATFRVTVAAFNTRALCVWQKAGFREAQRFGRHSDGQEFLVLTARRLMHC